MFIKNNLIQFPPMSIERRANALARVAAVEGAKRAIERDRIAAITGCEEAKGRESLASHIAMNTNISPDMAKKLLHFASRE